MVKYYVDSGQCIDCLVCYSLCPASAVEARDEYVAINDQRCTGCGDCARECPLSIIYRCLTFEPDPGASDFDLDSFYILAEWWMNTVYKFGGNDLDGIDCSHLVWRIYCEMGLYYEEKGTGELENSPYFEQVTDPSDILPGDLLLWPGHHVAIYIYGEVPSGEDQTCDIYGTTGSWGVCYCHSTYWINLYGDPVILRWKGSS